MSGVTPGKACYRLDELASAFDLEFRGAAELQIHGVCTLSPGKPDRISFLANPKLRPQLQTSKSGAVIVGKRDAAVLEDRAGLIAPDPTLAYARIARLFDTDRRFDPGVEPSAVVSQSASVGEGSYIGANTFIDAGASIGSGSYIGPNCVIGRDASIGPDARLLANVYVCTRARVGSGFQAQPGVVLGGRGFGNAQGPNGWEEIPQLGSVVVGDDVEIGSNTCIDRGALEDTVIGNNVRLDNLIQIAHNCHIGDHTAIAACVGIAGSTSIGARCMIGGQAGVGGHLKVVDDVIILGQAMVTKSLTDKGVYGSGVPAAPAREWRKDVARFKRLGITESRLKLVQERLGIDSKSSDNGEGNSGDDT